MKVSAFRVLNILKEASEAKLRALVGMVLNENISPLEFREALNELYLDELIHQKQGRKSGLSRVYIFGKSPRL